ncbi:uncharacterized protein LOC124805478 [Schistocerca piceifrons]|uniref:uncharacterized protein LOC124805478 n=1 Tax=Schistocerca piceifrons TaxID=274613 RepID=UPI001F5F0682|nr:uncharacterized protein LOC124805478 [Schistocerca piceifrons]
MNKRSAAGEQESRPPPHMKAAAVLLVAAALLWACADAQQAEGSETDFWHVAEEAAHGLEDAGREVAHEFGLLRIGKSAMGAGVRHATGAKGGARTAAAHNS